ncbi:ABC transporter ATP-binding protein [Micrococcus sp. IITD107]|uniref:ABC transporter ATP-binding protein n=1 Tax=Micrococcus sp. IITD107 TaxID=3342790 RepID=UPI0035B901E1
MLSIEDLSVHYGPVHALRGVSLSAESGRITAVLGANGAGKTTLLRTISGLVPSTSGRIVLDGQDITRVPAEAKPGLGLSQVPEGRGVITELSIEENLKLGGLSRADKSKPADLDRIYDMFPVLGERRDSAALVLSGGERQMLVVGRALMATPKVLVLDEPSLGLAPRIVTQIFSTLRRLAVDEGLAVLLVEQNARSALSIADHGVVLNLGKVVAQDDAQVLAADSNLRHAYLGF